MHETDLEAVGAKEKLLPTPSARQESSALKAVLGGLLPHTPGELSDSTQKINVIIRKFLA
jgi:hypothetical protein